MAASVKSTLDVMDVIHTLIDKSGADEATRLDMHDAIDVADKARLDAMDDAEKAGRRAPVDRLSSGVGGGAASGLTKADLDAAVAEVEASVDARVSAAVAAALAAHGIGKVSA